jgi:hypothetical protein
MRGSRRLALHGRASGVLVVLAPWEAAGWRVGKQVRELAQRLLALLLGVGATLLRLGTLIAALALLIVGVLVPSSFCKHPPPQWGPLHISTSLPSALHCASTIQLQSEYSSPSMHTRHIA